MSETAKNAIHIVVIIGSVRPGNYTSKAVALVEDELKSRTDCSYQIIDPATMTLPLPGLPDSTGDAKILEEAVSQATGVIVTTPEYHGSFSSVIKLVLENMGFPSALAGKPVALMGVAGGVIGAVKSLESLRGVCSHVGSIVLPGAVSVAGVNKVFDEKGHCQDASVEKRVRSVPNNLVQYIQDHICPRLALEDMVREQEG